MDENRPAPRLGTPEAAVQAAVNLIAKASGINESRLAYYLDMYYQLRAAYEAAKAEEYYEVRLPDYPEPSRTINRPEAPEPDEPLSVTSASTGDSSPRRGSQEREESPEADEEDEARAEALRAKRLRAKRLRALEAARKAAATVDRKGKNNPMAQAAQEKRRIRERLLSARTEGRAATPELLKAGPELTEGDVWKILNGHSVGIEVYRLLESALDRIEDSISKDDD